VEAGTIGANAKGLEKNKKRLSTSKDDSQAT
jgi:hypothetical protein